MLYATMRIGNNCEYFLFQSIIDSTCVNNNILIITPTKIKELNVDEEYKNAVSDIEHLDMNAVNKIFEYINKTIHASYE